jgi:hypothetical protein
MENTFTKLVFIYLVVLCLNANAFDADSSKLRPKKFEMLRNVLSLAFNGNSVVGVGADLVRLERKNGGWIITDYADPNDALIKVIWDGRNFVALSFSKDEMWVSKDGKQWDFVWGNYMTLMPNSRMSAIKYFDGLYYIAGEQQEVFFESWIGISEDLHSWDVVASGLPNSMTEFYEYENYLVLGGFSGMYQPYISKNGSSWNKYDNDTSKLDLPSRFWKIATKDDVRVGFCENDICVKKGGAAWRKVWSQNNYNKQRATDIVRGDRSFVVVGYGGLLLSSENGIDWSSHGLDPSYDIEDVIWTGSHFIAGGRSGVVCKETGVNSTRCNYRNEKLLILESVDGITWSKVLSDKVRPN